jgi:hypothetical protein
MVLSKTDAKSISPFVLCLSLCGLTALATCHSRNRDIRCYFRPQLSSGRGSRAEVEDMHFPESALLLSSNSNSYP